MCQFRICTLSHQKQIIISHWDMQMSCIYNSHATELQSPFIARFLSLRIVNYQMKCTYKIHSKIVNKNVYSHRYFPE